MTSKQLRRKEMTTRLKSYVSGEWFLGEGDGTPLINPSTGQEIARASTVGLDCKSALHYSRSVGGPAIRAMSFADRGAMLQSMAEALHAHREELLALSTESGGNTRGDAKFDIDGGIQTLSAYAKMVGKLGEGKFLIDGDSIRLSRSPRFVGRHVQLPLPGVAIHINAFNFPIWGFAEKAAVALGAGMPICVKPATSTSALTARAMAILIEAGVAPNGVLSMICGGAGDLLEHVTPQDVVAFTGSAATAAMIRSMPSIVNQSVRVNVEADSLNAAVLGPDVEPGSVLWDLFLMEVGKDMTQKAGQKCTAMRRLFVPANQVDQMKSDLSQELDSLQMGNPTVKGVRVGPVATASQWKDTQAGIAELMEHCDCVHGEIGRGNLVDEELANGYFQTPVLLVANDPDSAETVHHREVFGPVATLMPYDGLAQSASTLVQKGGGTLVTSVYSDDRTFASEMMMQLVPYSGRLNFASRKVAEHSMGPGTVLPTLVHGGPGRAGGGEELGGLRGLSFYMQRTALQGDDPMLAKMLELGTQV